nr:MAG TPA: hypothetical protein [Caudoviricetes sp.]
MKNTSFIFYATFYESTQCLSQNRRGKFLCKLLAYMTGEDAPVFSDKEKIEASLFLLMQPQIKANLARRENGKAGAEHGSKGGRPKKDAEKETPNEERTMPESEIPEYSMPSIDWSEVENADADEFERGGETVNEIEAECAVNRTHDTTDSTDSGGIYIEENRADTGGNAHSETPKYGESGFQTVTPRKNPGVFLGLHDVNPKITPNVNVNDNVNGNVNENENENENEKCPASKKSAAPPAEKSQMDFPLFSPPAPNTGNDGKESGAQMTDTDGDNSPPQNKTDTPVTGEPLRLSELLRDLHKKYDKGYCPPLKHVHGWAEDIEKLHRIDRRDYADIERVIRWVKNDSDFWRSNIMSGKKLRRHFDMLILQMTQRQTPHFTGRGNAIERSEADKIVIEAADIPF